MIILPWPKMRQYVLERGPGCAYCCDAADQVDHVLPRSKGGADDLSNLVAACGHCNASKGANTPYDWVRKTGILLPPWWYLERRPG